MSAGKISHNDAFIEAIVFDYMKSIPSKAFAAFEIKSYERDLYNVDIMTVIAAIEALEKQNLITLASGDEALRRWKIKV